MKVEIIRAWPRRFEHTWVELPAGSTAGDALAAASLQADAEAFAVFGVRAGPATVLHDGDRIELLRPLQVDPKDARRARAAARLAGKP